MSLCSGSDSYRERSRTYESKARCVRSNIQNCHCPTVHWPLSTASLPTVLLPTVHKMTTAKLPNCSLTYVIFCFLFIIAINILDFPNQWLSKALLFCQWHQLTARSIVFCLDLWRQWVVWPSSLASNRQMRLSLNHPFFPFFIFSSVSKKPLLNFFFFFFFGEKKI